MNASNFPVSPGKTLKTNMVSFNGVPVIDPSTWSCGEQDISKAGSGRDEAAKMHTGKFAQKVTYKLGWNMIDPVNASQILQAVGDMRNFKATLFDPKACDYVERTFYVDDRTSVMKQWMPDRVDGMVYSEVGFTIIEV